MSRANWRKFIVARPVQCEKSIHSIGELCSTSVIIVEHAAQDVSPLDRTVPCDVSYQRHRTLLVNALVRSCVVVILDVRRQNSIQVTLVEDQDSIEALLSDRPDPTLGKRICIWRPHWRSDDCDILRPEDRVERHRKLGVAVMDQESHRQRAILDLPAQLPRLLCYPRIGRV